GERSVRNAEVEGSIPFGSTKDIEFAAHLGGFSRLWLRTWGSHLRLLARFARGVSSEPAGDRTPPLTIRPAAPVTSGCLSPSLFPGGASNQ
ncbi:MAG: hypothetical protein ABUJ98_14940, partial [Hyphomicrobium sp.]